MVVFNREPKVEIRIDQEKLDALLAAMERMAEQIEVAATRAAEVIKQLNEASEKAALKTNNAAKELSKAADKARNSKPPRGTGGSTW